MLKKDVRESLQSSFRGYTGYKATPPKSQVSKSSGKCALYLTFLAKPILLQIKKTKVMLEICNL